MKLQNFIIIFIIIIIPIVSIFLLYLNLETKTITMQTDYDEKLIEATKEAVEAFEINTVEWNSRYSSLANSKRQDLMSSINVFTTSLASKIGIGGTSKENILSYIPAIVYIMYDGYYIYAPTYIPKTITNENGVQLFYYENGGSDETKITASATQNIGGTIIAGEPMYVYKQGTSLTGVYDGETITFTTEVSNAEKTYEHVLKTFVPYTTNYEIDEKNYVINYTLDNYIRIFGEDKSREGYIVDGSTTITVPQDSFSGIKVNDYNISCEDLTENIYIRDDLTQDAVLQKYLYIYNSNNDKRYYDASANKFFMLNDDNVKVYLPDSYVGHTLAEYKKLLICTNNTNGEYIEIYQLLNSVGNDTTWYYKTEENEYLEYSYQPNINKNADCSAINYYVETYCFNTWLRRQIGLNLAEDEIQEIIDGRIQSIINNVNNNLNLSISNYNANTQMDFDIFKLTDEDWKQALSNISMITFFQGVKIGLKTYNNYAIVTSTENNEYVSEDSLYYPGHMDRYYHRYGCKDVTSMTAYRNTDFIVQSYEEDGEIKYYYKHYNNDYREENNFLGDEIYECFECIVNRNNYNQETNYLIQLYDLRFYRAIARERYIQIQRTKLIK